MKDLHDTRLYNDVLLAAMQRLSLFEDHRVRQRVNYSALDVEELGSVYESLLDFQPAFAEQPNGMIFDLRTGASANLPDRTTHDLSLYANRSKAPSCL
ncbi:MAG: hypothetical protein WCB53_03265 [Terriglobales bacterium]